MRVFNYAGKDSSLTIIHDTYEGMNLNDEDIYSLAKYYANYGNYNRAEEIIEPPEKGAQEASPFFPRFEDEGAERRTEGQGIEG